MIAVNGFFFVIDCIFFAANSTKLFEGGWFPLLLAGAVAFLMLTWRSGVKLVERARGNAAPAGRGPDRDRRQQLPRAAAGHRGVPGVGAERRAAGADAVRQAQSLLHQRVVLVTVLIEESPRIADEDRAEVIEVIPGITRVILHYGFMQYPTIYQGLVLACEQGKLPGIDLADITYYIGRETIIPSEDVPGMWVWREACSRSCSATPSAPPRSSACRPGRWSSSAPRSRFEGTSSFRDAPTELGLTRVQQIRLSKSAAADLDGAGTESILPMVVMDSEARASHAPECR